MKNTISLAQFRQLETLAFEYNDQRDPERELDYILAMLTTEYGDGPEPEESAVMVTIEAYDWDGLTDFGTLSEMLERVGVELDTDSMLDGYQVGRLQNAGEWEPQPYMSTGYADYGSGRTCRTYGYCLMLN
jgi:hypothetical protein